MSEQCTISQRTNGEAIIATLQAEIADLRAQLAKAKELLKPFAMLAELDAKDKDGLDSVYPMVAAGRLHDARRFLFQTDDLRGDK